MIFEDYELENRRHKRRLEGEESRDDSIKDRDRDDRSTVSEDDAVGVLVGGQAEVSE